MQYIKSGSIYNTVKSVVLDGKEILNPTKDQILAAGYKIYVHELTLEEVKEEKIKLIDEYDTSSNVNEFYYNDIPLWIDKSTRVGLKNSTQDEITIGRDNTTLIFGELILSLPCTVLIQLLTAIEVYAKDCYNVTAQHKINIMNMDNIESIQNYDITSGYPEKLQF